MPFPESSSPSRKTFYGSFQIWCGKRINPLRCTTLGMLGWVLLASWFPSWCIIQLINAFFLLYVFFPHFQFMVPGIGILGLMQHCDPAIPAFRYGSWYSPPAVIHVVKIATDWDHCNFDINDWVWSLIIVNHACILITRTCEWNWLKGTLCTVDRRWEENDVNMAVFQSRLVTLFLCSNTLSFGTLLEHHVHHINDCHLTHHLFPKIPSYNFQVMWDFLCRQFWHWFRLKYMCLEMTLLYIYMYL